MHLNNLFFKIICEEVDVFGKNVYEDVNVGTLDEVKEFIAARIDKYPVSYTHLLLKTIVLFFICQQCISQPY